MNSIWMQSQYETVDIKRQDRRGNPPAVVVSGVKMLITPARDAENPEDIDRSPQPLKWRGDLFNKSDVLNNSGAVIIQNEDLIFRAGNTTDAPDFVITNAMNAVGTNVMQLELESRL